MDKEELIRKLEDIEWEDFSLPRNPLVAKMFRFVRFSENIGSGFHKMFSGWKKHYGFNPIVEGDFDYYKITFPTTTTTTSKTTSKTTTKKDNEVVILDLLENNPQLTADEIANHVGLTVNGVRYHLKNLKKRKLIERVGGSKKGYWKVKR